MIEYKIDHKQNSAAINHVKDMDAILREISNTYEVIFEVLVQQEAALSTPTINAFRKQLKQSLVEAISLSDNIVENARKLVVISEQADRQLSAFEASFNETLDKYAPKLDRPLDRQVDRPVDRKLESQD